MAPRTAMAAVTTAGNVTPAPPAGGGNLAGPLLVGDSSTGILDIDGGTPLNITSGSVTVADDATAFGSMSLIGLGSNLTTAGISDLIIGNNGAGAVTLSEFAKITLGDDLFVAVAEGSSGSLFVDNFASLVDVNDAVQVGQAGTGVVEVTTGARFLADDTVIGQTVTGNGRVTILDQQSLWRQTNTLTVGDAGSGLVEIFSQGRMETTNVVVGNATTGVGIIEVGDSGSVWEITGFMHLGVNGRSTLAVLDGGRVTNTSSARMATLAGGESHAEVSGPDSLWSIGTTLTVGEFGFGTLAILNGGRVTSTNALLADNTGSRGEVTVDGINSTWEITGTLDVSEPGEAKLTISNGGLVTTTGVTRVNAAGELNLNGGRLHVPIAGGLTNQGLIRGGGWIVGLVTNSASGEIRTNVGDALVLGNNLTNAGLIDLDGGEMEVLGTTTNTVDIDVRDGILRFQGGLSNNSGGQLAIVGGNVDVFGLVNNNVGAEIAVGGTAVAVFHDAVTNNGTLFVQPGGEVFMLENLGFGGGASLSLQLTEVDLTQPNTEPSDAFGQVQVAGAAALAGTLEVHLVGGYMPTAGDSFQILTAGGGRSGVFGSEVLPSLSGGLGWDVRYNPDSVVLSVITAGLIGDYNDDGIVDQADYVVWRKFNNTMTTLPNDSTPGEVNALDYNEWRAHFGQTAGSGSGATRSAPEPGAFMMLLTAMFATAGVRKGCRR